MSKKPTVAVIGAGLAGLTTAYRLHLMGFNVNIYEARSRVGGRVFTVNVCGHPAELGAQNILDGGQATNMRSLIDELSLETQECRMLFHLYFCEKDALYDIPERLKSYKFTSEGLKQRFQVIRLTAKNMQDVLRDLFKDDEVLFKTFSVRLAAYEGAPVERLSCIYIDTLSYMLLGGLSAVHPSVKESSEVYIQQLCVKGGNSKIAEKLVEKLSDRVHLGNPLVDLAKKSDGSFLLTFKSGLKVDVDIVVLAVPCSVYEDIHFQQGVIPSPRLQAIRAIQYGTNSKILVPTIPPQQEKGQYTDGCMITYFHVTYQTLNLYFVGEAAKFDASTVEATFQKEFPIVNRYYVLQAFGAKPALARDEAFSSYAGPVGHCWLSDPYAKGSYSCVAPGQEEVMTTLQRVEQETLKALFAPIDQRLFFAGEHATILADANGTMEAAVESGERVARLIKEMCLM